jgi:hypothetical protein
MADGASAASIDLTPQLALRRQRVEPIRQMLEGGDRPFRLRGFLLRPRLGGGQLSLERLDMALEGGPPPS